MIVSSFKFGGHRGGCVSYLFGRTAARSHPPALCPLWLHSPGSSSGVEAALSVPHGRHGAVTVIGSSPCHRSKQLSHPRWRAALPNRLRYPPTHLCGCECAPLAMHMTRPHSRHLHRVPEPGVSCCLFGVPRRIGLMRFPTHATEGQKVTAKIHSHSGASLRPAHAIRFSKVIPAAAKACVSLVLNEFLRRIIFRTNRVSQPSAGGCARCCAT